VVYLYFVSDHGLTPYYIYGHGFLAEYEKVRPVCPEKSSVVLVIGSVPEKSSPFTRMTNRSANNQMIFCFLFTHFAR